jgi:aspartate-semialdehyde dehydrogenase
MAKNYNIAVIGATGNVGREILNILSERRFPVKNIYAVASSHSIGKEVSFGDQILKIISFDSLNYSEIDIAFFCTSSAIAKEYIPKFTKENSICIDKSSAYRMDKDVALVVPEVNYNSFHDHKNKHIIASPNCCVVPLALVLKPLDGKAKIKRVVISTYQSASGVGKKGMDELYDQTKSKYAFGTLRPSVFPKQIAFNIFPQIGDFDKAGDSEEETKIQDELYKIIGSHFKTSITCVRVPVFIGHSMAVNIEFESPLSSQEAENILKKQTSIHILSSKNSINYLTPVEIVGEDFVHVSRVREDKSIKNAINLWVVSDNLRKGAALNSVQIAECFIKDIA